MARQLAEACRREAEIAAAYRGTQAQLVLANRHCTLLQGQLNAKESAVAARRDGKGKGRLMGDGFGRVITQGAFYDQSVENRRVALEEEEAKRQREINNAEKKRMRDEWGEQEKARKAADKEAYRLYKEGPLAAWEVENAARKVEGRKSRWAKPKPPKRSKRIPKPWLAQEEAEAAAQVAGMR
ncbi:hypothetical protein FRC12_001389 [Ceratobasidium sp. 428]|nr:hypothetical protein FRC12_001389 [Ceratobasidium sp. 428]